RRGQATERKAFCCWTAASSKCRSVLSGSTKNKALSKTLLSPSTPIGGYAARLPPDSSPAPIAAWSTRSTSDACCSPSAGDSCDKNPRVLVETGNLLIKDRRQYGRIARIASLAGGSILYRIRTYQPGHRPEADIVAYSYGLR